MKVRGGRRTPHKNAGAGTKRLGPTTKPIAPPGGEMHPIPLATTYPAEAPAVQRGPLAELTPSEIEELLRVATTAKALGLKPAGLLRRSTRAIRHLRWAMRRAQVKNLSDNPEFLPSLIDRRVNVLLSPRVMGFVMAMRLRRVLGYPERHQGMLDAVGDALAARHGRDRGAQPTPLKLLKNATLWIMVQRLAKAFWKAQRLVPKKHVTVDVIAADLEKLKIGHPSVRRSIAEELAQHRKRLRGGSTPPIIRAVRILQTRFPNLKKEQPARLYERLKAWNHDHPDLGEGFIKRERVHYFRMNRMLSRLK